MELFQQLSSKLGFGWRTITTLRSTNSRSVATTLMELERIGPKWRSSHSIEQHGDVGADFQSAHQRYGYRICPHLVVMPGYDKLHPNRTKSQTFLVPSAPGSFVSDCPELSIQYYGFIIMARCEAGLVLDMGIGLIHPRDGESRFLRRRAPIEWKWFVGFVQELLVEASRLHAIAIEDIRD